MNSITIQKSCIISDELHLRAYAPDSILDQGIAAQKPMILGYGTGR